MSEHIVTHNSKQRVKDMSAAGIPKHLIARILEIDEETLTKHYEKELVTAQAELVDRIAKVVAMQAEAGDQKSQALYLKTQGAKFGWVEKQVIEQTQLDDTKELKDRIAALEKHSERDY